MLENKTLMSYPQIILVLYIYNIFNKIIFLLNFKTCLAKQITEVEVEEALRQLPNTKASRPDGMQGIFLKRFWTIMKPPVMNFFEKFMANEVDLNEQNFT